MDTEFARTFLTVIKTGSFVGAAAELHVTQSTVSSRIRALETDLGCRLLVRNKAGATLTPAGRAFQQHATKLLQTLARARHDVGVPQAFKGMLSIGARIGLWDDLLTRWLGRMAARAPDVAVRAEIGFENDLMQQLVEGALDIAVMYTPQSRPALVVERLLEERLVLVRRGPSPDGPSPEDPPQRYVHVDWGPEFYARHQTHCPHLHPPALVVGIGWLGLEHILRYGGMGYFPARLLSRHLVEGRLETVEDAPTFTLPAYMVYAEEHDQAIVAPALQAIREIARCPSAPG
ncbi:MAG: LysR family transcriptional regulator [Gammaproteobacteria bacterium]|nr:LysR family transcriptional regulator [Gammaproteobacteria bacterium]